jgi:hypothetical protein
MAYQPFGPLADMGPLGVICHAIWILACNILYLFYDYVLHNVNFAIMID